MPEDSTQATAQARGRSRGRPRANRDASKTTASAGGNTHHRRTAAPKLSTLVRGMSRKIDQMGEEIRELRRGLS